MTLPQMETIFANIVVVPGKEGTSLLSSQEIGAILEDADVQALGQPAQHMEITSLREQVRVSMGGGRFVFEDRSGGNPKAKLAEITSEFVRLFASKGIDVFRACGFNFDIAFDAPGASLAAKVVMDRFVKVDQLNTRGGISLIGAGLRLYFDTNEAKCDLRIEPRESNPSAPRFFSHANYHYDLSGKQFPPVDTLKSDYLGKWNVFTDLVERLVVES
jgi:hypothetical protein